MSNQNTDPQVKIVETALFDTVTELVEAGSDRLLIAQEMLLLGAAALVVLVGEEEAHIRIAGTAKRAKIGDLVQVGALQ